MSSSFVGVEVRVGELGTVAIGEDRRVGVAVAAEPSVGVRLGLAPLDSDGEAPPPSPPPQPQMQSRENKLSATADRVFICASSSCQ